MTEVAPDLDNLINEALQHVSSGKCWAVHLTGEAAAFIQRIEQKEAASPGLLNRTAISRILKREYGVTITSESIRHHLNRECRCDRP